MISRAVFMSSLLILTTTGWSTQWTPADYLKVSTLNSDVRFSRNVEPDRLDVPLLNAAVFTATNEIRRSYRLRELKWNRNLEISAWNHARRMAEQGFFSHDDPTDPQRRLLDQRGRRAGILNPRMAENIATHFGIQYRSGDPVYLIQGGAGGWSSVPYGDPMPPHTYATLARGIVAQWMDSPPHRANILNPNALELGCGMAYFPDRENGTFMPMFAGVQNFQWYDPVRSGTAVDPGPK